MTTQGGKQGVIPFGQMSKQTFDLCQHLKPFLRIFRIFLTSIRVLNLKIINDDKTWGDLNV